jgi:hypothetical protein
MSNSNDQPYNGWPELETSGANVAGSYNHWILIPKWE